MLTFQTRNTDKETMAPAALKPEAQTSGIQQAQILTVLSAAPLNRTRLWLALFGGASGERRRSHKKDYRLTTSADPAILNLDRMLNLLQVKGLVQEAPHPLRHFRTLYITDQGCRALDGTKLPNQLHRRLTKSAMIAASGREPPCF